VQLPQTVAALLVTEAIATGEENPIIQTKLFT